VSGTEAQISKRAERGSLLCRVLNVFLLCYRAKWLRYEARATSFLLPASRSRTGRRALFAPGSLLPAHGTLAHDPAESS